MQDLTILSCLYIIGMFYLNSNYFNSKLLCKYTKTKGDYFKCLIHFII